MKALSYVAAASLFTAVAWCQGSTTGQPQPTTQQTTQENSQKTMKSSHQTESQAKTQHYSGTLMDASCANSGTGNAASTAPSNENAGGVAATNPSQPTGTKSEANRTNTADQGATCNVSSSTTQFAIKMKDGQVVKFDDIGNQRAQEALKAKKKWTDAASANKPVHVSVTGMMSGDRLLVTSIN